MKEQCEREICNEMVAGLATIAVRFSLILYLISEKKGIKSIG